MLLALDLTDKTRATKFTTMNNSPITIVGNLTGDPEVTQLASGTSKATFDVAVPHRYQRNGEWQESTSFLKVIAWGYLADNLGPLEKGLGVIVVGRMTQRSYETDEGQKRYVYEIQAENVGINSTRLESVVRKPSGGSGSYATANAGSSSDFGPEDAPW